MADQPREFGRYVLLKSLGSGGTGDVHLARPSQPDDPIPSPVVVKRLHDQLGQQETFVRRFSHEAAIAVAIDSPHVAKVFDVGRVGGTYYLAMEYIAGWTLSRVMNDFLERDQPAPIDSIADIICEALDGLSALHDARHPDTGERIGFIHRDIAPKNIMVGEDGVTRLIDLGLGRSTMQDWKTSTGIVMGSPGYMAPEQVVAGDIDHRADIFSMGIVLWEMLTQRLFIKRAPLPIMLRAMVTPTFQPPSAFRPEITSELDSVVIKALALDERHRFDSAAAFREALRVAVPRQRAEGALPAMIGDMLWGELASARTEVTQLLSRVTPTPMVEVEDVQVLAARYGPVPTPHVAQPPALNYAPAVAAPTYTTSGDLRSGGVPVKAVVGLMFLMLLLGVTGTLLFTMMSPGEGEELEVAPVVDVAPSVGVKPQAAALQRTEAAAKEEPPPPPARTKRRAEPTPAEPVEAPPAAPTVDPEAALDRLYVRAVKFAKRTKDDDAKALLGEIARAKRGTIDATRVTALEERLEALQEKLR